MKISANNQLDKGDAEMTTTTATHSRESAATLEIPTISADTGQHCPHAGAQLLPGQIY